MKTFCCKLLLADVFMQQIDNLLTD